MSGGNVPPSTLVARPVGLIIAGALALGLLAVLAGTASRDAGAQSCTGQFTIDFAGLPAGTILGEQYAAQGVHISAEANRDFPDALIVFDTNAPPTHDPDLAVDIGNIAILANNLDDENGDGLVDDPDENNFGGVVTFTFDQPVTITSFRFVDHDHQSGDFAATFDASGNLIEKVFIPVIPEDGSVQTINIDADGVSRFVLDYADSAGFTGIEVECPQQATPTPTTAAETPTPTAQAETPTPAPATPTPTAAPPTASPSATPTAAAAASTPVPAQAAAVAGAAETPARPAAAVLGAEALPAGGGPQSGGKSALPWAAALAVIALVLGGSIYTMKRKRR